jgi:two-component system nitrogen regulation sensor histidine kinase NtrY
LSLKLRTRMTLFFLGAALPGLLLAALTVVVIDRLLAQEIEVRTAETIRLLRRALEEERGRVAEVIDRFAASERVEELISALERDPSAFEELAAQRAAESGLEVLGIVAARGLEAGHLISSAHLPSAIGDPGPAFLLGAPIDRARSGVIHEYLAGNPPQLVPVLVAARAIESPPGQKALYLYGGVRLDGHRLQSLASMTQASLRLVSPGLADRVAGGEVAAVKTGAVTLPPLPEGRTLVERAPGDESADTRIEIGIPRGRLESARRIFVSLGAALILASLGLAWLGGAWLSRRVTRPILELADAARAVGRGDLSVRLQEGNADEVGALVQVFNQMTAEIGESREKLLRAERVAAWQQIARRVAHEIKNPLSPIQMTMETLRKSYRARHPKLDEIVEESTRTVLEEVRALNRIVAEFSDFARLPSPQKVPTAPHLILAHLAGLYPPDGQPSVEIQVAGAQNLPELPLDRQQLERALINLIKNALEAVGPAGRVQVSAELKERAGQPGLAWVVEDNGPGMPADVKSQIFTPYFTTKSEGTGLGLPIVERIITEHGGRIEVHSEAGRGTRFVLWLPLSA